MKCGGCGKRSKGYLPDGWFTLEQPGRIDICSPECMDTVFDRLNQRHRKEQEEWSSSSSEKAPANSASV